MSTATQPHPRYSSLTIGMEFDSLKTGVEAVTDAIVEAHESFKVKNGNTRYWAAECRKKAQHTCGFQVTISLPRHRIH
jgi:hypothetical protein